MQVLKVIACMLLLGSVAGIRLTNHNPQQTSATTSTAAPESSPDAESVRAQILSLEAISSKVPDRAAMLFLLAQDYAHVDDSQKALQLLKQCVGLDAGFVPDPEKAPSLRRLASNTEFRGLLAQARLRYPPVHHAKVAFTVEEKDLFPEGLGVDVDVSRGLFYMGSMHHKKIVKFTLNGSVSDFVREGAYDLSPVGGVHVDGTDHSVWASTDAGEKQRPELLHFDAQGKLLERYASPGRMPYDLNDLVLRGTREIFVTDTEGHHVYRFDRSSHTFTDMKLWRPVFYPNGITLSGDGDLLFVADLLGVIRVDLRTNESADVDPGPHNTLAGVDGLYWSVGGLIGVQYGTGAYRVMRWRLAPDARKVTSAETLEYGTPLVSDPTTGAILGGNFYFMANTGIYNLENDRIVDPAKMESVQIAVVPLR